MSEQAWRDGYGEGFADGYRKAKQELTQTKPYNPPDLWSDSKPSCRVCGMKFDKPMGYVCMNDKCPSRVTCGVLGETHSFKPSYTYGNAAERLRAAVYDNGGETGC